MKSRSLSHVANDVLIRHVRALTARGCEDTADLLAHLGEIDARRLYAASGYPSMHAWCMGELHFSEDAAFRRIRAARTARLFPALFPAIAEGRLHLTAVILLTPHLTPGNLDEWVAAATHKGRAEIELLLAHRFPRPDVPTTLRPITAGSAGAQLAPAPVEAGPIGHGASPVDAGANLTPAWPPAASAAPLAPAPVAPSVAADLAALRMPLALPAPRVKLTPLAPERFELRATLDQETHELLRRAQALLGHTIPSGDMAQVLKRVLGDWVGACERRRFAATDKPRPRRSQADGRYVPAEVRRAVVRRDGGQCTYVSDKGRRCPSRARLEFDHVVPVARGGRTTVENLRLRCAAHNQYAAEQAFGAGFMRGKREAVRTRRRDPAAVASP